MTDAELIQCMDRAIDALVEKRKKLGVFAPDNLWDELTLAIVALRRAKKLLAK